ncbi:MAG: hypothetical protein LAO56_17265 [Acidobacteriia bacterium]|nr:hypothetical protein [Terriglobia bacterium]
MACLILCSFLPALAQSRMTVRGQVHHDVSAPLRDLIQAAPQAPLTKHEAEPVRRIPLPPGLSPLAEDPVRQQTVVPFTPVVGTSFEGLGSGQYGFTVNSAPPDTNGTVGATQYVQWVNTSFAVFNKTTGALVAGPTAGNTLWSGFGGGCQTNNDGDPVVLYDKAAQRWIFSQFSVSTTPFLQCIAVSTTSDATGTYNRYSFQYGNFDDYPKMGVWSDAYYETFNMFNGNTFVGSDACAYNRAAMLAGTTATQVCFQQGSSVGGLLPSDLDGNTAPPAGSPNYMVYFGTNNLNLYKFHVDFATPSNSSFTGPTVIPVAAFSPLCSGGTCVVQPGTTQRLDSLADRLMYRLAYRNFGTHESLVVNHSVVAGSSGGIRWYEIQNPSGTPTVAQQSTFAPDASYRWMGSIAMDQAGDMAVGYSLSSSSLNPTIRYTGRVPTDPASTMEAEVNVVTGTGSQTTGLSRWGDYSAMQVDPVDDCTFWYTQEYIKTNGTFNWNTRIANFKFPGCGSTTPDFTVGASPSSVSVTQGSTATSTITVTSLNGFNSAATLSASGLPAGVTASFSPNPVTPPANGNAASTLTFTASSSATTGTSTVTVTGTSGSTTHTTTITLTVNAAATPNFTISAAPSSVTVTQGGTGTSTVTITSQNSFSSATTLSATGLPTGVTAAFSTNPVTPPANGSATSTLTFTASASATVGTATVTVTGTSGTLTHSTTIALTVNSSTGLQTATYNSTLKTIACASVGIGCDSGPSLLLGRDTLSGGSEPNQPNTINSSCADGTSGTFHSDESNDRLVIQTTDGSTLAPGKTVRVSATVWVYSSFTSDHLDLYYAANASSPTWALIATITPTAAGAQTLSATYTLPSGGASQAVRAQFRYQGSASSCTTGSYNDHDDLVFAVGGGTPGFSVSASPSAVAVVQGSTANSTVTVSSVNGFNSATTLSVSGLPTGVTAGFSTNPVTPPANGSATSTLTFTASSTATTGPATVTVTGTSGSLVQTVTITLTVTAAGGAQTAVYDSTLRAPKCATVGSSCDSGTTLLQGRDTLSGGAESNQPNTINGSCSDGTSGTFHSDESNDRIVVTSTGGGALTHGTTVTVTATVWAYSSFTSDHLDLYYAANANSPTWVLIGTFTPSGSGARSISATYTLPTGSLQAVRANFRYLGSASSCSTGAYDDHDDLIFASN